jgi:hypothetical protein
LCHQWYFCVANAAAVIGTYLITPVSAPMNTRLATVSPDLAEQFRKASPGKQQQAAIAEDNTDLTTAIESLQVDNPRIPFLARVTG